MIEKALQEHKYRWKPNVLRSVPQSDAVPDMEQRLWAGPSFKEQGDCFSIGGKSLCYAALSIISELLFFSASKFPEFLTIFHFNTERIKTMILQIHKNYNIQKKIQTYKRIPNNDLVCASFLDCSAASPCLLCPAAFEVLFRNAANHESCIESCETSIYLSAVGVPTLVSQPEPRWAVICCLT